MKNLVVLVLATLLSQTATPTFEVATIKRNVSGNAGFPGEPSLMSTTGCSSPTSVGPRIPLGRCVSRNVRMRTLIASAYGLDLSNIDQVLVGQPKWIGSEEYTYDLEAKAENPMTSAGDLKVMLQNLLAERFKLKVHWETRDLPSFALKVEKGGIKMKRGDPAARSGSSGNMDAESFKTEAVSLSMERLAEHLSIRLKRLVVDMTGLSGGYDFKLTWARDETSGGPSIFAALQDLGLRLESTKAPTKVLVIDNVEHLVGEQR